MEPPATSPPSANGNTAKLRLMCSYGGNIVPRPGSKSLCYVGGDTRIVAIDPQTITTLSSFVAHLSVTFSINFTFILKYQLPHLDFCSLISVISDDDFHILIEEHHRLSCSPSPAPSRIRVFLFPSKPDSGLCLIRHPKSETWFSDALKGVKIMQKGRHSMVGFDGEAGSGVEAHNFLSSGPESMVLETSSSFGSTSSSASLSNMPPLRAQGEDNEVNSQDAMVKLILYDTAQSDGSVSNILSSHERIVYQDPAVYTSSMETRVNAESVSLETMIPNISPGHASISQVTQVHRQPVQILQAGGAHIIPQNPSGMVLVPSYSQMYQPQQPLQHLAHHHNQPYPIYFVPMAQIPPNNLPSHFGVTDSSQASWHVVHNFQEAVKPPPFASDISSQNYVTDLPSIYQNRQSAVIAPRESPKQGKDSNDELAQVQIYKSQPPPPSLPSQH